MLRNLTLLMLVFDRFDFLFLDLFCLIFLVFLLFDLLFRFMGPLVHIVQVCIRQLLHAHSSRSLVHLRFDCFGLRVAIFITCIIGSLLLFQQLACLDLLNLFLSLRSSRRVDSLSIVIKLEFFTQSVHFSLHLFMLLALDVVLELAFLLECLLAHLASELFLDHLINVAS